MWFECWQLNAFADQLPHHRVLVHYTSQSHNRALVHYTSKFHIIERSYTTQDNFTQSARTLNITISHKVLVRYTSQFHTECSYATHHNFTQSARTLHIKFLWSVNNSILYFSSYICNFSPYVKILCVCVFRWVTVVRHVKIMTADLS